MPTASKLTKILMTISIVVGVFLFASAAGSLPGFIFGLLWISYRATRMRLGINRIHQGNLDLEGDVILTLVRHDARAEQEQKRLPVFSLLLRPFLIDDDIKTSWLKNILLSWIPFAFLLADRELGQHPSPEARLAFTMKTKFDNHLITVADPSGDPLHREGAGTIKLGDVWKEDVRLLIDASEVVFIIPFPTEGTQYEVDLLLSSPEYLSKTVFIIPPLAANGDEWDALEIVVDVAIKIVATCGFDDSELAMIKTEFLKGGVLFNVHNNALARTPSRSDGWRSLFSSIPKFIPVLDHIPMWANSKPVKR